MTVIDKEINSNHSFGDDITMASQLGQQTIDIGQQIFQAAHTMYSSKNGIDSDE